VKERLLQLAHKHWQKGLIFFFQGGYGVGERTMAEALCRKLGSGLLVVDLARMLEEELPFETAVRLVFREALQDAALYWDHYFRGEYRLQLDL
jgi:hypothetical protein